MVVREPGPVVARLHEDVQPNRREGDQDHHRPYREPDALDRHGMSALWSWAHPGTEWSRHQLLYQNLSYALKDPSFFGAVQRRDINIDVRQI